MGSKSNSLTIRLTESVVFLKQGDVTGRRSRATNARSSMLRGLLVLELVKPMKISSIEIRLQGKTSTAWPEGVGARRIEVTEDRKMFTSTIVFFRAASTPSTRRTVSVGPGLAPCNGEGSVSEPSSEDESQLATPRNGMVHNNTAPPQASLTSRARRISADSSFFQSNYFSHHEYRQLPPTPPYIASAPSPNMSEQPPHPSVSGSNDVGQFDDENPAQTLEDFRNALMESRARSSSATRSPSLTPVNGSSTEVSSSSARSTPATPLSRQPSIEDVPEDEPGTPKRRNTSPLHPASSPLGDHTSERRSSRSSRFSFASVSNVFSDAMKDHVQPKTPQQYRDANSPERRRTDGERGRVLDNGKGKGQARHSVSLQKEGFSIGKLGDFLKSEGDGNKEFGDGWKEFKKGTYTFPIGFAVPGDSPPTLTCAYGSVSWCLKAEVHRPGTFTTKLQSRREVILIASPGEDTDDTENLIVERMWDTQLQYLISISGRSFYIGGTIPIQFTLMPLTKMKVYQIAVWLEERIDYYTVMKRLARTDPIRPNLLLSLKSGPRGKEAEPILPLSSDRMDAFMKSPMYDLLTPDDDPSEMASSLMGPGPWVFHRDLQLPASCTRLHFTNKNQASNMIVSHTLKITMRVERGDDQVMDPKTGKRKLFDILVHLPVQILSCRCNPEWTSLPPYSEGFEEIPTGSQTCPCITKRLASLKINRDDSDTGLAHRAPLGRMNSQQSVELAHRADGHRPPPFPLPLRGDQTLFAHNTQFERLVSGQESEIGEAPPSYVSAGGQ